ncbi:helix-turn-helix domain-containing protein [Mangrovimonas sp. AS39]|uniref:helix-turn-helix domain-containing protein n=1 Tax=Mangrovimonas futianensis TaxID=2895523 RepID=UPI001E5997E7|nr:helix-turn-helix domain-containing protein [Mangrovimonas futianensis]MCF1190096.1 helix-turn-helix domain-containing protein [Mangrovimonas futianensis]MCF1194153.1 helix-turn-helix domain-containing protein [Mangrovimonas futianensis]
MKKSILQIENISTSELIPQLVTELRKVIKEEQLQNENNQDLLTRDEAAKLLSISLVTLWKYTKEDIIPAYRIGTKIRYKKADILTALKQMNKF